MLWRDSIKIVILFTLLVATFIFSMLPLAVRSYATRAMSSRRRYYCRIVISLLSCFAAGVFIGTCLLDLFPEVERAISKVLEDADIKTNFPLHAFIIVLGFMIMLIIEQFVLTWKSNRHRHRHRQPLLADYDSLTSSYGSNVAPTVFPEFQPRSFSPAIDQLGDGEGLVAETDNNIIEDTNTEQTYSDPSSHSVVRSFILLMALSIHSLFEGLAIGLQQTVDGTVKLFAALALHKCIVAFSIGLNMVQSRLSLRAIFVSNIAFSVASPAGIAIGVSILDIHAGGLIENAVIGCLQGLACGTFIYIVFFEILPHEFMKKCAHVPPDRLLKVLFLLLGFSVIVGVVFMDPDDDE